MWTSLFAVGCVVFIFSFYKKKDEDRKSFQIAGIIIAGISLILLFLE